MSNGKWGGRFPYLNFISSNYLFLLFKWRLQSRKTINWLRNARKKFSDSGSSDVDARAKLDKFLVSGIDKLNIGGGAKNLSGFINIDFVRHTSVEREIIANINDLSFISDHSINQVHSNHVIEHLSETQIKKQFIEYKRFLKPGGLLTLRCPNALGVCYGFFLQPHIENEREEFVKLGFPCDEDFGSPDDGWMHKDIYGVFHWLYGDVGNPENEHLTLVTPTKITKMLDEIGFEILKISDPESVNIVLIARRGC